MQLIIVETERKSLAVVMGGAQEKGAARYT